MKYDKDLEFDVRLLDKFKNDKEYMKKYQEYLKNLKDYTYNVKEVEI